MKELIDKLKNCEQLDVQHMLTGDYDEKWVDTDEVEKYLREVDLEKERIAKELQPGVTTFYQLDSSNIKIARQTLKERFPKGIDIWDYVRSTRGEKMQELQEELSYYIVDEKNNGRRDGDEEVEKVFHFANEDIYLRFKYSEDSYSGFIFNWDDVIQVFPRQKNILVYEP